MSTPQSYQDAALLVIDGAVTALVKVNRRVNRAIDFALEHGLDGDEIRQAFQRAGLELPDVLAACESGAEKP